MALETTQITEVNIAEQHSQNYFFTGFFYSRDEYLNPGSTLTYKERLNWDFRDRETLKSAGDSGALSEI